MAKHPQSFLVVLKRVLAFKILRNALKRSKTVQILKRKLLNLNGNFFKDYESTDNLSTSSEEELKLIQIRFAQIEKYMYI